MTVLQIMHCLLDVGVAVLLMSLAWESTKSASFRDSPQRQWAAIRRIAYAVMAVSFFARGMIVIDLRWRGPWLDLLSGLGISLPVLFFLIVRHLGLVDQDHWVGWRHRRPPSMS
jgi:hypothetical protein